MVNIHINNGVVIANGEVIVYGVKMPPCPAKGHNSTIINGRVYLNGYELTNGKWRRTFKSLWYKWF